MIHLLLFFITISWCWNVEVNEAERLQNLTFTETETPDSVRAVRMATNITKGRANYSPEGFSMNSIHRTSRDGDVIIYVIIETKQVAYQQHAIAL